VRQVQRRLSGARHCRETGACCGIRYFELIATDRIAPTRNASRRSFAADHAKKTKKIDELAFK